MPACSDAVVDCVGAAACVDVDAPAAYVGSFCVDSAYLDAVVVCVDTVAACVGSVTAYIAAMLLVRPSNCWCNWRL